MPLAVKRLSLLAATIAIILGVALLIPTTRARLWGAYSLLRGRQSIENVLAGVGPAVRARLAASGAPSIAPRSQLTLVALKQEKMLYVFAAAGSQSPMLVKAYPILAASGGPGPKTVQGDNQVPEGIYHVESLNPNSAFHLALRLDYPNDEDRRIAEEEGRDPATLGGDIMIHGKSASIGCLAMGDEAIEEIFTLAADVGIDRIEVLIMPFDVRSHLPVTEPRRWVVARYGLLAKRLDALPPLMPSRVP